MNKDRLVVCLESQLHIYELATMKCLQVLSTSPNAVGVFALSGDPCCFLAFPSGSSGSVVLYDTTALRLLSQIDAHRNTIQDLQFDRYSLLRLIFLSHVRRTGTLLATASSSGTVLRIFCVPSGEHLCSFRRGTRPTRITSMSFSADNKYLAVGSASGTIHIFCIEVSVCGAGNASAARLSSTDRGSTGTATWRDYTAAGFSAAQDWTMSVLGGGLNALPEPIQEFAGSSRAVAYARLPSGALRDGNGYKIAFVSSLTGENNTLRLVAITQQKYIYRYALTR